MYIKTEEIFLWCHNAMKITVILNCEEGNWTNKTNLKEDDKCTN